jgi:hypothetical protein
MDGNFLKWACSMGMLMIMGIPCFLYPQDPEQLNGQIEEMLFMEEAAEVPESLYEKHEERTLHPLNMNNATREQLYESGLFTPFQIEVLSKYRAEYGPFYSIFELAGLPGFRLSRLQEIEPYLIVGTGVPLNERDPRDLMIMITAGKSYPPARGFLSQDNGNRESPYVGSAMKAGIRIKATHTRSLSLGLGYEKDPGEQIFNGIIPEFLSGYMAYKGNRHLKQLILGTFRVHHGLGLVNGSGFMNSMESFSPQAPSSSSLAPYASLNESAYERGMGCRLELGKVRLTVWSSYRPMDLSFQKLETFHSELDWREHERSTGLHRTTGELSGRSLAYNFHQGLHASVQSGHLTLGSMIGIRINGLTRSGIDTLQMNPGPSLQPVGSIHGKWYNNSMELSGELAVSKGTSIALLASFGYRITDFLQGLLLVHHYGSDYRGMYPSSYASGSHIENDQGIAISWHLEAGRFFLADLNVELFRYPAPGQLVRIPSSSYRLSCSIKNAGIRDYQWRLKISKKVWQITPVSLEPGPRPLIQQHVTRMDLQFKHSPAQGLQWQSRILLSWHSGQETSLPAYAAAQRISVMARHILRCTLQLVSFHVTEWENRIYLYEPGLYYSFNFPVCFGTGEKFSLVASLKAGRKITLSGKITLSTYHDRNTTGSGYDERDGNKKWDIGVQLRLNL